MKIEEMKRRKQELGYTNAMIAALSGVPQGTVDKVLSGATASPRRETILALERVLRDDDHPYSSPGRVPLSPDKIAGILHESYCYHDPAVSLREEAVVFGTKQGRDGSYTIDDYLAVPEDRRVELIDGRFYDMASPSALHQSIIGRIYYVLLPCIDEHPDCALFLSPSDVPLGEDRRTVVQPDLYIRCHLKDGAADMLMEPSPEPPDFVIEVLGPSSRRHDMIRKLNKYMDTGVREYWIVDPVNQQVIVYNFEQDGDPLTYTFKDTVPVRISGGTCSVDFSYVWEKVKRFA